MVWVIFGDKIGDVARGRVVNGFVLLLFEFYSLGNRQWRDWQRGVEDTERLIRLMSLAAEFIMH